MPQKKDKWETRKKVYLQKIQHNKPIEGFESFVGIDGLNNFFSKILIFEHKIIDLLKKEHKKIKHKKTILDDEIIGLTPANLLLNTNDR